MTRVAFSAREVGRAGAALVGIGQLLEEYATECSPEPTAGFTQRVVSAVGREQPPTPPVLLLRSLRERSVAGVARYLAGSLEAAIGARRSFPLAVRAQAIAVVLVAVIVLTGGGVALAAGAAGLAHALAPVLAPRAAPALQHSRPAAPGHSHVRRAPHHKLKPHQVPPAKGKSDDDGRGGNKQEASGGRSNGKAGSDDSSTPEAKSPSATDATHSSAKPKRSSAGGES